MNAEVMHYTATAKWLHWIMAALIIGVWLLGFYLADLPKGAVKSAFIQWHKAFGTLVLPLIAARLLWRLNHRPPVLPASMTELQQKLTHWVHGALYILMVAQPVSGWGVSSAHGFPVALGGVIPLPALVPKDEGLAELFTEAHEIIGWMLALLIVGHIAMALKHHFVDRDAILLRMAPRHGSDH